MSCSAPEVSIKPYAISYIFYLPITAQIWKYNGFDIIIVLTGEKTVWETHLMPNLVIGFLEKLDFVQLYYLESDAKQAVLLAQVSRLLVTNFMPEWKSNDFVMTTDVDFWPVKKSYLEKPPGTLMHLTSPL